MKIYEMTFGDSGQDGRDYFFSPTTAYNITKFQRPYTWEDYQIRGVFQDIEYALATDKVIGWPSMLIQENRIADAHTKEYDLGDGQQRSTTVFLFLMAIWHKWKLDYRETNQANEIEYFNNIFHIGRSRTTGILARKNYGEIKTSIEFQVPSATEKIHNLFDTELMTKETIKNLKESISEKDGSYKLYENFVIIWNELCKSEYSEEMLKKISEILLTKIVFPVVVYSEDEDMFRAFANTNSFGEPLTQSELVKAEFYGRVKKVDSRLADEIADYWNNEMDSWFAKNKTDTMNFDWFLTQEFNIFDNWAWVARKQSSDNKLKRLQRSRWLKTEWQKHFNRVATELENDPYKLKEFYNKTFNRMKDHFGIIKLIVEKEHNTQPLSKEWEMQYTHSVFSSIHMGMLFQLNDEMREKDFIETMKLLRKYYFYNTVVLKDKNPQQLLVHRDSPLRTKRTNLLFEDFEKYFTIKVSSRGEWFGYEETSRILSNREYTGNTFTPMLNKLFVYINNEKLIENGHGTEQKNIALINTSSREHIAPQNNKNMANASIEEKELYERKISMLGNMLVITGSENSAIKNAPVKDKIKVYNNSKNTPWGSFWIEDFLKDYNEAPEKWAKIGDTYKAIDKRSKKLAKIIANYISVPNNGKIEIGDSNAPIKMLTIEDTKGNRSQGKSITNVFVEYLEQITKDQNVRKTLIENSGIKSCFYYPDAEEKEMKSITPIGNNIFVKIRYLSRNEMMSIINELKIILFGYNTTLTVEYDDNDDSRTVLSSQPKINHKISDSLGNEIEEKSSRKVYIEWVKELAKNTDVKQEFYKMLNEGSKFFSQSEHIDKNNNKWTEKLDESLYLMINIGSEEASKRIDKLAEHMGISVEIDNHQMND